MSAPSDAAASVGGPPSGGVVVVSPKPRAALAATQSDRAAQRSGVGDLEVVARAVGLSLARLADCIHRFIQQRRAQGKHR
eukprot:459936-Alexandrium_andersonii.AAC.1